MVLAQIKIQLIIPGKRIGFPAHSYGKGNISYAKSIVVRYALLL